MKLNTLMVINAIVAGVFGIAFVLVPGRVLALYGTPSGAQITYIAQFFGGTLIAIALITWMARNAADSDARQAIVASLAVGSSIGCVIALIGQLRGVVNTFGWSTVVIYFLLAVGFWSFAFRKAPAGAA